MLDHVSRQVGVAAHRVISLNPARRRRQRRQSARYQDDATFDIHDLDGGPDNAPERGIGEARPHGERHDVAIHHLESTSDGRSRESKFPEK